MEGNASSSGSHPHVVILGGGFGGLAVARGLADTNARVTLIDRRNHHLFQPLLYQVATAGLSAPSIAAPLRQILRSQSNVTVLMDEAQDVDLPQRRVLLDRGTLRSPRRGFPRHRSPHRCDRSCEARATSPY